MKVNINHNAKLLNDIEQIVKKQKPYLKQTSVKQYAKSISILYHLLKDDEHSFESFHFIKDIDKVTAKLTPYSYTTRRNYFSAIITLLQSEEKPDKDLIIKYTEMVKTVNEEYVAFNETGVVSEKQKDKLIKMEQIDTLLDALKKDGKTMEYILFKLLTIYHLRNEVATLQRITPTEYNKLSKEERGGNNYLIVGSKKITISRNDYKTNKKYGNITINITDKEFLKELRDYVNTLPKETNAVFSYKGEMMTKKRLTNHLMYISNKYIGVGISTTMLAKSILSHKYADGQTQQKKDAAARGHSVGIQNNIYVKKLPEEMDEETANEETANEVAEEVEE